MTWHGGDLRELSIELFYDPVGLLFGVYIQKKQRQKKKKKDGYFPNHVLSNVTHRESRGRRNPSPIDA